MTKFAWLLAAPLLASSAWSTDLLQTYREAQDNDAVFAAARATAVAGREKEPQALAGLLPLDGGRLRLWGQPPVALKHSGRRMAFVFQSPTLMPWARVQANVRPENTRSLALLERLDFEREGLAREYLFIGPSQRGAGCRARGTERRDRTARRL